MNKSCRVVLILVLALAGCSDSQDRSAPFIQEATRRQAEQSQAIAKTSHEVAETSKAFLKGEADARRELIELQENLRSDQRDIGRQRDALELKRHELDGRSRQLIAAERRDQAWAAVFSTGGIIAACLAPLVIAAAAIWGLWQNHGDGEAADLILDELVPRCDETISARISRAAESPLGITGDGQVDSPRLPPAT